MNLYKSKFYCEQEKIKPPTVVDFVALYSWFVKHQRKLVFRRSKNPYYVYLSEVMLQQTRVDRLNKYFTIFINRFPTIKKLAFAHLPSVLRYWSGLGYYMRAKNLHQSAKIIVKNYGGQIPNNLPDLLALPGIGAYTARAILSIAYRQKYAVVDANLKRVLGRYYHQDKEITTLDFQNLADQWLGQGLVAGKELGSIDSGVHNEALMELGGVLCLPRNPICDACPLSKGCQYSSGKANRTTNTIKLQRNAIRQGISNNGSINKKSFLRIGWHSVLIYCHPVPTAMTRNLILMVKSQEFPFLIDHWHLPYFLSISEQNKLDRPTQKKAKEKLRINQLHEMVGQLVEHFALPMDIGQKKTGLSHHGKFRHSITRYQINGDIRGTFDNSKLHSEISLAYLTKKVSMIDFPLVFSWQPLHILQTASNLNKKIGDCISADNQSPGTAKASNTSKSKKFVQ